MKLTVTCKTFTLEQVFPTATEAFLRLYELKLEHEVLSYAITKV